MSAPVVYRSTDVGAPILTGSVGSLLSLLDDILVNGYTGAVKATFTITSDGTTVSNNDTITINGVVYTWKTALTPAAGEVLIGANAAANLSNLAAAIGDWGTRNTNYGTGTTQQTALQVTALTSTTITLTAFAGGTGGNSLAVTKSAAHISLSGATFAGGSGTGSGSAGWTKAYTGTNRAAFRQAAGNQFYLYVGDDAGIHVAGHPVTSKDAGIRGWEVLGSIPSEGTGVDGTHTGPFPDFTQKSSTSPIAARKSGTADATNRAWIIIADDRTLYVFIASGDNAGRYPAFMFGDIYSLLAGDGYRTMIVGRSTDASAYAVGEDVSGVFPGTNPFTTQVGVYMARSYTGTGGSISCNRVPDYALVPTPGTSTIFGVGAMTFPNSVDGGIYLSRVFVQDAGPFRRGWMRGFWHFGHPVASVSDADTFTGSGDLAGRTFLVIKSSSGIGLFIMETSNTWDTSS